MKSYPATIHRDGGPLLDENGDQVYNGYGQPVYTEAQDIDARYYRVRRRSATELDQGRQTLVVSVEAAFVKGTDIRETDEVTIGNTKYAVQGVYTENQALRYTHADLEAVDNGTA